MRLLRKTAATRNPVSEGGHEGEKERAQGQIPKRERGRLRSADSDRQGKECLSVVRHHPQGTGRGGDTERRRKMWKVRSFKGHLPEGFALMEDEDSVSLVFEGEEVAKFSRATAPEEIEATAKEHLAKAT